MQARYVREARALYAHGTHLCELSDNDCASASASMMDAEAGSITRSRDLLLRLGRLAMLARSASTSVVMPAGLEPADLSQDGFQARVLLIRKKYFGWSVLDCISARSQIS